MVADIANKQVSEVLLEARVLQPTPTHKRARVTCIDGHGAVVQPENLCVADEKLAAKECSAPHQPTWHTPACSITPTSPEKGFEGSFTPSPVHHPLPPVPETPSSTVGSYTGVTVVVPEASSRGSWRAGGGAGRASPRPPSPTPSSASSSTFSAATTSATMSSRGSSLSSCRSWMPSSSVRGASSACSSWGGSTGSFSRPALSSSSGSDFFPTPSLWDDGRRRRGGSGRRDRSRQRELERSQKHRRWSSRDYASEAEGCSRGGSRHSGRKRSRESSRGKGLGVECSRCMEWCRGSRERKAITRTLPMEYWVRTQECKDVKSKHIEYIDNVAYSREQFIEETVFTCPFTGVQRDIVLERNMFPYDVPTDVEHWTLWSRRELEIPEMETWVENWAAKNHPHAVEWEFDNNEGDRSIDWYHVHVFFRLGCEDKTGAPRDPSSVYHVPCGTAPSSGGADAEQVS